MQEADAEHGHLASKSDPQERIASTAYNHVCKVGIDHTPNLWTHGCFLTCLAAFTCIHLLHLMCSCSDQKPVFVSQLQVPAAQMPYKTLFCQATCKYARTVVDCQSAWNLYAGACRQLLGYLLGASQGHPREHTSDKQPVEEPSIFVYSICGRYVYSICRLILFDNPGQRVSEIIQQSRANGHVCRAKCCVASRQHLGTSPGSEDSC